MTCGEFTTPPAATVTVPLAQKPLMPIRIDPFPVPLFGVTMMPGELGTAVHDAMPPLKAMVTSCGLVMKEPVAPKLSDVRFTDRKIEVPDPGPILNGTELETPAPGEVLMASRLARPDCATSAAVIRAVR